MSSLRLDHDIIDIGLNVAPYLLSKATLNGPLIGGTSVFESKGHGGVAVGAKWRNE